jgi:3-hydroxyisobutyrate dehydrogenase-like beta-hydroxyacid dehydrogenase
MLGTAEAMLLGIKLGLEPKMLADIINSSSGRCWSSEINNPAPAALEKGAPADRDYNGGCARSRVLVAHQLMRVISFQVKLMSKDLKLAMAAAKLSGTELVAGKTAADVYGKMEKSPEYATKDFSSVYKMLQRASTAVSSSVLACFVADEDASELAHT